MSMNLKYAFYKTDSIKVMDVKGLARKSFVVAIFALIWTNVHCQAPPYNSTLVPNVIPPSPDAAALGKYANTPVGLYTGTPNINIPVYTAQQGSLSLPISLSYMATGIKVNEVSSWVGLGWALNAGGVVSRSVVGKVDLSGFWSNTVKSFSQIDIVNDFVYLKGVADNIYDAESDYYFYNFNGRSGKFVYKQNGSVANPQLIPEVPIKIAYTAGFQITDEFGVLYKFGYAEQGTVYQPVMYNYESAYYLTEMVSADGVDHIYFNYLADNTYTETNASFTETIGEQCTGMPTPSSGYHVASGPQSANRGIVSPRLTSIDYANGKVEFISSPRSDLPPIRLQEIKIWSKRPDASLVLQKSFVLGEGYFTSSSGLGKDMYRLKLTSLSEKDASSKVIRAHSFNYEESITFPHRSSLAQDWWGLYNGQTGNTSLIASATETVRGLPYQVGGANRNPNANTMQVGILKKIIYPTGGSTEFDYEPHYYAGGTTTTQSSIIASCGVNGDVTNLQQQTQMFTPLTSGWATIVINASDVTDTNPFYSYATVKKQGDTQLIFEHRYDRAVYNPYPSESGNKQFTIAVTAGITYEVTVKSKGHSSSTLMGGAAFSKATVSWYETTAGTSTMAGGLRLKEMRDYASPGTTPIVKAYKYGLELAGFGTESGYGQLLVPPDATTNFRQENNFIHTTTVNSMCAQDCQGMKVTLSGRPAYDMTMLSGSPVVYDQVTVYEGSSSAPNGRQVVKFDVQVDQFGGTPTKAYNNGRFQLNDHWKGGDEILNTSYIGNTVTKAKETASVNGVFHESTTNGTKIGWAILFEGCGFPSMIGGFTCCNDLYFYKFDYPLYSGAKKLTSTKETMYSSTGASSSETLTNYYYDNGNTNHQQLSRQITIDSKGDSTAKYYWYPADYGTVDNIPTLMTKNIVGVPVKEESYQKGKIVGGKINRYNTDGKPFEIYQYEVATPQTRPRHNSSVLIPSGYNKKIDIGYDPTSKKITSTQLTNDVGTSYLWGYNNTFPVAKILNATVSDAAVTSFESDGKGNWAYAGPVYNDIPSKTGKYYYKLGGGNITKTLAAGTYKLEYWAKGTVTLTGGTITNITTRPADPNGWIFYEKQVTLSTSTTFTLSGAATAFVDELRMYPSTAQVISYTYDVANGMTSSTDPNNIITYYEYDAFGRFRLARDQNKNIVKMLDYHYKGY